MKKNFKKVLSLTCVLTMLASATVFGANESTGGSIIENDNSVAPSYLNCVLPLVDAGTYDFTIDVNGLLDKFDTVGTYASNSNIYFNAQDAAATLAATAASTKIYVKKNVVDATAETDIENMLLTKADKNAYTSPLYYVWQPDRSSEDTIAAGKGVWTQITSDTIDSFFDITIDATAGEITAVTMKDDYLSAPDVWDGNIYKESYVEITGEEAAAYANYDEETKTLTSLTAGLFLSADTQAYTPATTSTVTYTPATRQFINVSDVATVVNKSTFPVAVSVNVSVTNENHGLVMGSAADFLGENDAEANIYMAIKSGSNFAALDEEATATAYYVLGAATATTTTYQGEDTDIDTLTGSHNYYQYVSPEVTYAEQAFALTATANKNYDWDAYIEAVLAAEITKPEIKVVYDFVQVEEFDDDDADTGKTYADEEGTVYVTETSDGWASLGSVEDTFKMKLKDSGYRYSFVEKPAGSLTAITVDGTARNGAVTAGNITYANGVLTINEAATNGFGLTTGDHKIVATIGGKAYTLTIDN